MGPDEDLWMRPSNLGSPREGDGPRSLQFIQLGRIGEWATY